MTTQQGTEQPTELGERVARLEGRYDELSPRIDQLQKSVDDGRAEAQAGDATLRTEMHDGDASLRGEIQKIREDISAFKNTMVILILGSWVTTMAAIIGTRFFE